jgi:Sodium:sulfate symporter transmembrane region
MGLDWKMATAILVQAYFYAHYFFASTTAHVTAMFAAFFATGVALGTPPMLLGLLLAFSSSLTISLTHYVTGTAPVIFGSGYATLNEWWIAGFVMSVVNIVSWWSSASGGGSSAISEVLDRNRRASYIAAYDGNLCISEAPPLPCHPGTGALTRLNAPRAAGFWPRHLFSR